MDVNMLGFNRLLARYVWLQAVMCLERVSSGIDFQCASRRIKSGRPRPGPTSQRCRSPTAFLSPPHPLCPLLAACGRSFDQIDELAAVATINYCNILRRNHLKAVGQQTERLRAVRGGRHFRL